ncbi:MAG: RluA family pseudouridine synthase [Clostridia bacterium]|nr:RluA family pseudouridine synthase [Clostridia bacterium]
MQELFFIVEENCKRLDVFLTACLEEFTRSAIKKLIEEGHVLVDGKPAKAGESLKKGAAVALTIPEPVELSATPEDLPLDIVYQDGDIAVVNKAQGMTVHAGNGNTSGTLVNALLYHLDSLSGINGVIRPGIVHRIDKDTSGLLVVAKNDRAHVDLSRQIAEKTCRRIYVALLEGIVKTDEGTIATDIGRNPSDRLKMAVLPMGRGKFARSDYRVLKRYEKSGYTLCEFSLYTGRTHQIRVHAQHISHPVVGDPVYGYKKQKFKLNGQLLHAKKLVLTHPVTQREMSFEAPLPTYFTEILNVLDKKEKEE